MNETYVHMVSRSNAYPDGVPSYHGIAIKSVLQREQLTI